MNAGNAYQNANNITVIVWQVGVGAIITFFLFIHFTHFFTKDYFLTF
jgi:hypothetical protein